MATKSFADAINPYALVEAVLRRRVKWSRIKDPAKLLARTLETPIERMFDTEAGSPVFAMHRALKHGIREVDEGPARGRDGGRPPFELPDKLDLGSSMSEALKARLAEILLPSPIFRETEYPGATWTDIGDFFEEGTEFADPVQGALGDCWLIAALSSVAWSRPYAILQRNRATGPGGSDFVDAIDMKYYDGQVQTYEVGETLPVYTGSSWPLYARSAEAGEIWPGVYEKAYAKLRTGNLTDKPDFRWLAGGDTVDACTRLVPGLTATYVETRTHSADELWQTLTANCIFNPGGPWVALHRAGRTVNPMTAWTYASKDESPDRVDYDWDSGVVASHAYSVLGWITEARVARPWSRYIVLRNPWGMHEGKVETLGGNWDAYDRSWMRVTPLNANGVFAMSIEAFKKYFAGLGVAA